MEQTMSRQHGTRAKYVIEKCRCESCTEANRIYARERDRRVRRVTYGIEAPTIIFVDATETREHLQWLSSRGVGKRQIQSVSGVALTTIDKIRQGKISKCRPETADRLLAVGSHKAAAGTTVDAKDTWRLINDLLKHGWTRYRIAQHITGNPNARALQIGKARVLKSTAAKVQHLHDQTMFRIVEDRRLSNERTKKSRAARATVTQDSESGETISDCSSHSLSATG